MRRTFNLNHLVMTRRGVWAWILPFLFLAASIGTRLGLYPLLHSIPFLPFYPAVVASALVGGAAQGWSVLLLSTIAGTYLSTLPPERTSPEMVLLCTGFLLVGGSAIVLISGFVSSVQRLDKARRAQEILFQELQHRFANNLQIIGASLQTARDGLADDAAIRAIDRAAERIEVIGAFHRRLYSPHMYETGLRLLIVDMLYDTFRDIKVAVRVESAVEGLSIDQMTCILMLVHEAAINAAKHVFRKDLGTAFEVSLLKQGGNRLQLVIWDNGPGIRSTSAGKLRGHTLGMPIMHALARQLGGELRIEDGPGSSLAIEFLADGLRESPARAQAADRLDASLCPL